MAQPSSATSSGFTINYFDRLPQGGGWLGDIDVSLQDWRHSVSAFGGFDTASFELVGNQSLMEDWIQHGLFRPIVVSDSYLDTIWEGFVDTITVNQAGLSVTYGPVSSIGNRVRAVYSGVDTSVYPPQIGVRKITPAFNNTASQALWGIWWEMLSLSGVTDSNADQLVGMYLAEHGDAEVNGNFSFSNQEISLTINCIGWYNTLNYPFNFTSSSSTVDIATRIQQILAANPNSWISTDYTKITANATTVPQYDDDNQLATEHLRGLTVMGNASNLRHILGIYEGRRVVYGPVSEEIDYTIELADPKRQILDTTGAIVPPWKVRPGKWIFFNDFLPGLGSPYVDFHQDPRRLRIETMQFDMRTPYAVQFSGGRSSKYDQRSARLGLRGMEV